jgi:hypothetical protein
MNCFEGEKAHPSNKSNINMEVGLHLRQKTHLLPLGSERMNHPKTLEPRFIINVSWCSFTGAGLLNC